MKRYFDSYEEQSNVSESSSPKSILKHNSIDDENKEFTKDKLKWSAVKKENLKKKQQKKWRIIIRNLSFKVNENSLKEILSKYGNVTDIKIPTKPDGKKRGFAFAQFDKFQSAVGAIKNLNFSKIKGRPVAIDFALPKDKFENIKTAKVSKSENPPQDESTEVSSDSDNENSSDDDKDAAVENKVESPISDKDKKVDDFLKEFDFNANSDDEAKNETDDSDSSSDDDENRESGSSENEDNDETDKKLSLSLQKEESKKLPSSDVQEGKTVFIRNIPFTTDQESFKEAMEEFGPVVYCLLCIDPLTELPRGTAFVKFKNKEDAESLITKASDESSSGVFFEHRKLHCIPALSRDDVRQKTDKGTKEKKDKRNLKLLREGLIMGNSDEAKGVSETDLKKRAKLELVKKQKLKNLNFFVSDTRLCIHNLPYDYTDQKLRQLFKEAVGSKAVIPEARIMRDMKKVNTDGKAKSKGFGFVTFTHHEHALEALHKLNNNSSIFSDQRRPIVEFSVESHLALLAKQRRREKNKLKYAKKKEIEENKSINESQSEDKQQRQKIKPKHNKKRKREVEESKPVNVSQKEDNEQQKSKKSKKRKKGPNKLLGQSSETNDVLHKNKKVKKNDTIEKTAQEGSHTSPKKKKSRNKARRRKSNIQMTEEKNFTNLVNQYKNKLLTKYNS